MAQVYFEDGDIVAYDDSGNILWSFDGAPFALFDDSQTIEEEVTINFPDFNKGNMASFASYNNDSNSSAISWGTILPGEWGPFESGGFELTRTLLGSVPSGTQFLDVSIKLDRTSNPDQILFEPVPIVGIEENKWSDLDGGCAVLEGSPAHRRIIRVVRTGDNIRLERYQSAIDNPNASAWVGGPAYKTDPQVWTEGGLFPWIARSTHGGNKRGVPHGILDTKDDADVPPFTYSYNKARGGPSAPSFTDNSDHSATYAGTIRVRPGFIRI